MHGPPTYHDDDLILGKAYDRRLVGRLKPYLRPYRAQVVLSFFLVAAATVVALLQPRLIGWAIDDGLRVRNPALLRHVSLLYLALAFAGIVIAYAETFVLQSLGQHVMRDVRRDVFAHVQTLSVEFFDRNPVGRLVTRVTNDVAALAELFSGGFVVVIGDCFLIAGLAVAMIALDARLAAEVLCVTPFLLGVTLLFRKWIRHSYREVRRRLARLNAFLQEHISGLRVVQMFGREERIARKFDEVNDGHFEAARLNVQLYALFRPVVTTLGSLALGVLLWRGGEAVGVGTIPVGTLVVMINYTMMLFGPIQDLSEKYTIFQGAMAAAERIFRVLDSRPVVVDPTGAVEPVSRGGEIRFDGVTFAYDVKQPVLRDVSWTIRPGERVAIVGATGAGKTTTLSLLQRFYDPRGGRIRLDGVDLREWPLSSLRRRIGVVQQDVFLFSGTIEGNLRMGAGEVSREAVEAAARAVGADAFIRRLPEGYDTKVMERGSTLSVGQRQLLAFARTLLCDPSVLVLDEATASIDVETERALQEGLWKVMAGRTALVVAHRLSTIERMDRILVMHHGRVREEGTHTQLMAQGGIYARLYRLQFGA